MSKQDLNPSPSDSHVFLSLFSQTMDDKISDSEEKFKEISGIAQLIVKDTPQQDVNEMLNLMTNIKDRLIQVCLINTNVVKPCETAPMADKTAEHFDRFNGGGGP